MFDDFYGRGGSQRQQSYYNTAQVCMNGHVINSMADEYPESNAPYCDQCGEKTITACPDCNAKIKGHYNVPGVVSFAGYQKPGFCDSCGKQYPWTQRTQEAIYELIEFSDKLSDTEKADFKDSVNNLLVQSPKTNTAVVKFKTYAQKTGKEIAGGIKDIIVDVVSETVKKAIWGG